MSDAFSSWMAGTGKPGKEQPSTKTIEGLKGYVPSSNADATRMWDEVMADHAGHADRRKAELAEIRAREGNSSSSANEGAAETTKASTRTSQVNPWTGQNYKDNYMSSMFNFFK